MPFPVWLPLILALTTCIGAYFLTGVVLEWLTRKQILDHPNLRSSHTRPTPRGGGWGIVGVFLPSWAGLAWWFGQGRVLTPLLVATSLLVAVCWIDDRRGVNPLLRLMAQAAAAGAGLFAFGDEHRVFQGILPLPLDRVGALLCWVWFMNLYNFMDGIDGLAAGETVSICLGVLLATLLTGPSSLTLHAATLLGAAAGFLVWNWQPARIFMGDVGSVPLGFALGWLLLTLAASGLWPIALLLPLYFLADATLTLLRRLTQGEKVWEPHREHLYQLAVRAGRSHADVTSAALGLNVVLTGLALWSIAIGWPAVVIGGLAVSMFLFWLGRPA